VVTWRQIVPLVSALIFAATAGLLFLTAWIVLPGWNYALFVLGVGAPEYSAWLLAGSLLAAALAMTVLRSMRLSRLTLPIALMSAILASIPLVRAAPAIRRFDMEMDRALGTNYLAGVPEPVTRAMRSMPIVPADLFRGLADSDALVSHGIRAAEPDGQGLTLTVYRPNRDGRFPAIVQIYGGAWQRGTPEDQSEIGRYLAARGYVVFAIDYRHAPRWMWPAQIADVRSALGWIRDHARDYQADVTRLALVGRSAGAQLALIAAYEPNAPRIRGVVSYYGPVDLADGYRNPPNPDPLGIRAIEEALLGGTPDSVPGRYREASPITYVTRRLPPTLLVYAGRDHVVEARFGRLLHERLMATGSVSALLEIPWAEHGFDAVTAGPSAQVSLYYTERFLAWALRRD
jgi:acetyl esterase/lipase